MRVSIEVPEYTVVGTLASAQRRFNTVPSQVKGLRQTRAMRTMKRYIVVGAASAAAGIVSDVLNRWLTGAGADDRLMQVTSVRNPAGPTPVREVREANPRSTSVLRAR